MNRLKGHITYTIGAIDACPNYGLGWREEITPFLQSLGIGVINPTDKPYNYNVGDENSKNVDSIHQWKQLGEYNRVEKKVKEFVSDDLHFVDLANFLIVYIDLDIPMCGSYIECAHAYHQHKPVIVCCPQGKANIPIFLFGMSRDAHRLFFSSLDEVKDYIRHIDRDKKINTLGKWRFINYSKIFNSTIT